MHYSTASFNKFNPSAYANVALMSKVLENDVLYLETLLKRKEDIIKQLLNLEVQITNKENDIESVSRVLKNYYK